MIKLPGCLLLLALLGPLLFAMKCAATELPAAAAGGSRPAAVQTVLKQAIVAAPPANPSPSAETSRLLRYYYELSNDPAVRVLIGQQIGHANEGAPSLAGARASYFTALKEQSGKSPAIMGVDYGWEQLPEDYSAVNQPLIDHWKQGGLVTISMSPGNPFTGGGLRDFGIGGCAYDDIITTGTAANRRWMSDLDKVARGLAQLRDAGVVVLWRPLHEMNGDFFWWSYGKAGRATHDEFAKLWMHMFNYFCKDKKLDNLLWVYTPNAALWENGVKDTDLYYPGSAYVDLVGMDYYEDAMLQFNNHGNYDKLVALGKPFGLGEVGAQARSGFDSLKMLDAIRTSYPRTVFALYWTGWTNFGFRTRRGIVENAHAKELMNDPSILTLDAVGARRKD